MANQVPAPPLHPWFRAPAAGSRRPRCRGRRRGPSAGGGPRAPRFCRVLLGGRGTGKTVLLDVIGEVAATKLGWAVLHVQALQEESLVAVLLQRIPEAVRLSPFMGRPRNFQGATGSATAGLSVSSHHWRKLVGVEFSGMRATALSIPWFFAQAMSVMPWAMASDIPKLMKRSL